MVKHVGFLGYSSTVSVAIVIFVTVVMAAKVPSIPCPLPDEMTPHLNRTLGTDGACGIEPVRLDLQTMFVMPTMAFSFVCHTGEMSCRTPCWCCLAVRGVL